MTSPDAGDCDGLATGPDGIFPENKSAGTESGWMARVLDTVARLNQIIEATPEERGASSARLDAVIGRYHEFKGVAPLEASGGNGAADEHVDEPDDFPAMEECLIRIPD